MLGDLILTIVKACTTLYRWAYPLPQRSVLEEDASLPPFHFTEIRQPSSKDRYDAWWARYILRTEPRAHEQAIFDGEQIKSRWQFEPRMRHYSPTHQPFKTYPGCLLGSTLYAGNGQKIGEITNLQLTIDDETRETIRTSLGIPTLHELAEAQSMREDYRRTTRNRLIDALYGNSDRPELPPGVSYIGKSKRTP
jgi:hypothetical protein